MLTNVKLQRLIHQGYCRNDPADPGEGGGGGGGGGGGTPPATDPPKDDRLSKADVDRIVKGRVEETRNATKEQIAKELGVSLEDAKKLIEAAQKAADSEKSEAQLAREAAEREKAEAQAEKSEAAQARHNANVERQLVRALPKDLDDEVLDKRVTKLAKLIDIEAGADAEAIKAGVDALREEWPELFGAPAPADNKDKLKPPPSDPKAKPPAGGQPGKSKMEQGRERAKSFGGSRTQYEFQKTN